MPNPIRFNRVIRTPVLAKSIPFYVDFSALPNGAMPKEFGLAPTWSIVNGKAICTPTEGAEVVPGNMDFENVPPSSWQEVSTTVTRVADPRTGSAGSYSYNSLASAANGYISKSYLGALLDFTRFSVWAKTDGVTTGTVRPNGGGPAGKSVPAATTSWTRFSTGMHRVANSTYYINLRTVTSGRAIRWDDASWIGLSNVYSGVRTAGGPIAVGGRLNVPASAYDCTVWGLFIGDNASDPKNGVVLMLYASDASTVYSVRGMKIVAGVPSQILTNTTISYVADGLLEIRRIDATTYQYWYNGTQIGSNVTANEAEIQAAYYAGMIATDGTAGGFTTFKAAPYAVRLADFLGTSITANNGYVSGAAISASRVAPYPTVNTLNLGVGGSTSWYALASQSALLSASQDVVCVEFAVNDTTDAFYAETAEALIRNLRTNKPNAKLVFIAFAKVANVLVNDATNTNQTLHDRWRTLCERYGVVFVSYADELYRLINTLGGTLASYMSDTVHPTALGHTVAAGLLGPVIASAIMAGPMPSMPTRLYDCADFERSPQVRNGISNDGETGTWSTVSTTYRRSSAAGSTITLTATCSTFGINHESTGSIRWQVDGGAWTTLDLTSYGAGIELTRTKLAYGAHTFNIEVLSGTVTIRRFLAI